MILFPFGLMCVVESRLQPTVCVMPIYAFECTACGHSFDRLQKLADPDPSECPSCTAASVRRQVTAPAFRLAGSGWYETDFKKDGDKKRNLAGDSAPSESKTESKTESKPAESKPATETKAVTA